MTGQSWKLVDAPLQAAAPGPDAAAAAAQAGDGRAPDGQTAEEQAERQAAAAAAAAEEASFFVRDGEGSGAYARRVFQRVFTSDIERVLRMEVRSADWCYRNP
jgi:hypothetical protein